MQRTQCSQMITEAKRIVVKVGTSSLTYANGKLNLPQIDLLARQLTDLYNQGKEVVLVSSGAIATGMGRLGLEEKPKDIPQKQALAAVGQGVLLHLYEKMFAEYGQIVAQLLLTKADLDNHMRFLNARNTLLALLKMGIIPIINENDTVSIDEIRIGDNDTLAATVGVLIEADLVILLSDIQGLYESDPRKNPAAKMLEVVEKIDNSIESLAGAAGSNLGTGGMVTKIMAAKIANNAGIPLVIAHGAEENVLAKIVKGENVGTLFLANDVKPHLRKCWITFGCKLSGAVIVDDGAKNALISNGKSLLSSGIKAVEGNFSKGAVVSICDENKREFARGMVNYSSKELDIIKGAKSREIYDLLGYKDYDEVIHRDNLGLLL